MLLPSRLTKLELIRQRKYKSSLYSPLFRQNHRMKSYLWIKLKSEVVSVSKKDKQKNIQPKRQNDTKAGYGDKKLVGPDRPST